MAFYQNQSTFFSPFPNTAVLVSGIDSYDVFDPLDPTTIPVWADLFINPQHEERRTAFQEFIFLMFYYQNRRMDGAKFPHNVLNEKVLRFFVETEHKVVSSKTYWIPKYAPIVSTAPTDQYNIFYIDSFSQIAKINPPTPPPGTPLTPAQHYPYLRTNYNSILSDIQQEMFLGNTSLGFFQETATLFAYFYFTRQLIKLNGYQWDFTKHIANTSPVSRIISRVDDKVPSTGIEPRSLATAAAIDKDLTLLPYFFNSLFFKMGYLNTDINVPGAPPKNLKFQIPLRPYTTDTQKINAAYFVKLLDPYRPIGVAYSAGVHGVNKLDTSTTDESIVIRPESYLSKQQNSFLQDLYVTIRAGNFDGSITYPGTKFYDPNPAFTSANDIQLRLKTIYDGLQDVIEKAVLYESDNFLKMLYSPITKTPNNVILATGAGDGSVSILGIKDFGLSLFNYKLGPTGVVQPINTFPETTTPLTTITLDYTKMEKIHLGVYALDLGTSYASSLLIQVDTTERYPFIFADSTVLTGDTSLIPQSVGSPTSDFYTQNTTTNIVSYFRKFNVQSAGSGGGTTKQPVLVAQYFRDERDLVFRQFTPAELTIYSLVPVVKTLSFTITSTYGAPSTGSTLKQYEEMMMLISSFEDESLQPQLINDDAFFEPYTFQLYGSGPGAPSKNQASYSDLFNKQTQKDALKIIFDLVAEEMLLGGNTVTFNAPSLLGGYVGRISGSPGAKVVADTRYAPKFNNPPVEHLIDPTNAQKSLYEFLKYSRAEIIPRRITGSQNIEISLAIKSHVSPSTFTLANLTTFYGSSTSAATKISDYSSYTNSGSLNQVLAMLRSFGLLEAIVKKMLEILNATPGYSAAQILYITNKIESAWLNPTLICKDDPMTTADHVVLKALDITLADYNSLKW